MIPSFKRSGCTTLRERSRSLLADRVGGQHHGEPHHREVTVVQPASPAVLQLAQRLRQLRQQHWPDARLTQDAMAKAFSVEGSLAAATVSSWESLTAPKLPPRRRLDAYARFFATRKSIASTPKLIPLRDFTDAEKNAYRELEAELLGLRSAVSGEPPEERAFSRSWHFADDGPATFICAQLPKEQTGPLGDPANPNYTQLQTYADLDALMELHGHIRAENPAMDVFFKAAPQVQTDDLSGHVILVGGIGWNTITGRLSEMARLPVQQVTDPELDTGEIFVAHVEGKEHKFWPTWMDSDKKMLSEDIGLLARVPNPVNSSRTLTICNGIHSRGVYGAVRSLTDKRVRESNERYIYERFGNSGSFVILMSVQVIENKAMTPDFNIPDRVRYLWPHGHGRTTTGEFGLSLVRGQSH